MKTIGVIFGGRSVEHDISILTALHAMRHISESVKVKPIYLTRDNKMVTGEALKNLDFYIKGKGKTKPWKGDGVDVILNCCHGGVGEGGELAAYMKVIDIPVTSADMQSATLVQNKLATREFLAQSEFDQPKFEGIDITKDSKITLDYPLIVKPNTLGSSIGITVARNESELRNAVTVAQTLDSTVIVEEYLEDTIEVNCSAFYSLDRTWVSKCELLDKDKTILDFDKKYIEPSGFVKKSGDEDEYDENEKKYEKVFAKVQELTAQAYELFGLRGVVRADFLIQNAETDNPRVVLNEINSIPGFLAYHLWARTGFPYGVLIDLLCKQAIREHEQCKLTTEFKSEILEINKGLV